MMRRRSSNGPCTTSMDVSDRMDVFQLVLYANGDIQFVYDMMETDAVGESYIDSFGWFFVGLDYDVDMVVGNPFDLEHTSYTMHPEDVSAGAGMYIASSEGNVNLDANDSVVRNFGDGAIWTYAQMGDIIEQITNCQFWYIVSGPEDGAIDGWTEERDLRRGDDRQRLLHRVGERLRLRVQQHLGRCRDHRDH